MKTRWRHHVIALLPALALMLGASAEAVTQEEPSSAELAAAESEPPSTELAAAQPERPSVELIVEAETPLRVALDQRIKLKRDGQSLTGTLVEPLYAYDRVVVPAGAKVYGHVEKLEKVPRGTRVRAMLGGDFTPLRYAVLEFDTLVLDDCSEIPIHTVVTSATKQLVLRESDTHAKKKGVAARAAKEVGDKAKQAVSSVKRPGKLTRLKQALVNRLPYHPQYLQAGTVYTALLLSPLSFGTAEATEPAPAGTVPPPESVLRARLLTALDSSKTPRGTPVQAVVTEPLFSEDHQLILPEGTVLTGEVTFAKPAARFHRNGQLRFLFESMQAPEQSPETLRASLYSVQVGRDERLAVDDEGGATITNSPKRFAAPALASVALAVSLHRKWDYDTDGAPPELQYGTAESHGIGGFFGAGLIGAGLSQVSRPMAVGFGILGVARTVFSSVAGRGRNVSFPAHTPIEVQLGAEPTKASK